MNNPEPIHFTFGEHSFPLSFHVIDGKIYLSDDWEGETLTPDQKWLHERASCLCDIQIAGRRTSVHAGDRHLLSSGSESLRYVSHKIENKGDVCRLSIVQQDEEVEVTSIYEEHVLSHVLRCFVEVKNRSDHPVTLEYVSSFCKYDLIGRNAYDSTELWIPNNDWYMEAQWKGFSLSDLGILSPNSIKTFKKFCLSNTGAWSSKNYLPMGLIHEKRGERYTLFQIEANGSWTYEIGDYLQSVSLHLSGPSLQENGWSKRLLPGECFHSVSSAITRGTSLEEVFHALTFYRREIIRRSIDHEDLPVIYNEYMHASWNEPSFETAKTLAPTAKRLGADYFVIDCGWHDEEINPFYYVGKWKESEKKYPEGLLHTLDYLRSLGLKVGLWMEPEVVGYFGDAKDTYPPDCYFQRSGETLCISYRYQLDFSHPLVYSRLLEHVSNLIETYHLDYLKFDYNIEPGVGTSYQSDSLGDGLLRHNRAYHAWISELRERFPSLVIESCASGGNRLDYKTLDNVGLCSTSDQDDARLYPYIVANILTAVLPEQAGVWAYPVDSRLPLEQITEEWVVLNLVNSFIGRIHLASHLEKLSDNLQSLVKEGIEAYKGTVELKKRSWPYFPLGLASFGDAILAFGFRDEKKGVLCLYSMKETEEVVVDLAGVASVKLLYPTSLECEYSFAANKLHWNPKGSPSARVFEVRFE